MSGGGGGGKLVKQSQCLRWVLGDVLGGVGWGGLTGCLEADSPVVYR